MAIGVGAAILGGSVIGGLGNIASANRAAEANEAMSREQMVWQQYMTANAHRIQVADMRAAGLNPILSATGGRGAVVPSGAHGTAPDARAGDAIMTGVSTALAAKRTREEVELLKQQKALNRQQELKEGQLTQSAKYQADLDRYEVEATTRAAQDHGYIKHRAAELASGSRAAAIGSRVEGDLDEASGEVLRALKRLGISGGSAAQILNLMRERGPRPQYGGRR